MLEHCCGWQEPLSKELAAHLPKWADAEAASSAASSADQGSDATLDRHHKETIEKLGAGLLLVYALVVRD